MYAILLNPLQTIVQSIVLSVLGHLADAFSSCPPTFPAAKCFSCPLPVCQVLAFSSFQLLQQMYGLLMQKPPTELSVENRTVWCLKTNPKVSSYFSCLLQVKPLAWQFPACRESLMQATPSRSIRQSPPVFQ